MRRFIQYTYDNPNSCKIFDHTKYLIVPLEEALQPLKNQFTTLDERIHEAKKSCHSWDHLNMTKDESASLYLYTQDFGDQSLSYGVNHALLSTDLSRIKPWIGFLTLFYNALKKISAMRRTVWRGISDNIERQLKVNDEFVCCGISSCSSSSTIINALSESNFALCCIETYKGKWVSLFSSRTWEGEVLLLPGTRLVVKRKGYDTILNRTIVYVEEILDESQMKSITTENYLSRRKEATEPYSEKMFRSTMNMVLNDSSSGNKVFNENQSYSVITFENGDRCETMYESEKKEWSIKFYQTNGRHYSGDAATWRAKGKGIRTWSNGDRHEGTFTDGKMDGYGYLACANGFQYVGNWLADQPHGSGTSDWPNGNQYEGSYHYGKITGKGTFKSINDDRYIGDLIDGKAYGTGVRTWSDGDRYEGTFENDKKHGRGRYIDRNNVKYKGEWAYDRMNGRGKMTWPSGTTYEGMFKNDQRHGNGKMTFANGHVQEGLWENDRFQGEGTY